MLLSLNTLAAEAAVEGDLHGRARSVQLISVKSISPSRRQVARATSGY
jgi:hypothetical protein